MSQSYAVSVVINTYNYGNYVGQAIESVLEQDFPASEREIIVIDDGSTDDTADRVTKYGREITYLRKQNGGQASAFNAGVAVARGAIICLLDADDYFYPKKLAEVSAIFSKLHNIGVVYNRYDVVSETGQIIAKAVPARSRAW